MSSREVKVKILEVAYHRNGVGGEGFYVVRFEERTAGEMVGIIFAGEGQCAVLSVPKLTEGVIAFLKNSWRGDVFEPHLRRAITQYNGEEADASSEV